MFDEIRCIDIGCIYFYVFLHSSHIGLVLHSFLRIHQHDFISKKHILVIVLKAKIVHCRSAKTRYLLPHLTVTSERFQMTLTLESKVSL
jgi:hypothetical protein